MILGAMVGILYMACVIAGDDDLLIEQIDLYNEVIDLQERIDKAIEYIEKNRMMIEDIEIMSDSEYVLEILKGDNK